MAEKVKSKRENNFGDVEEISEGGTRYDLLRFLLEERKKEEQQETCNQQFLRIIETMTEKGHGEKRMRDERRRQEQSETRRIRTGKRGEYLRNECC